MVPEYSWGPYKMGSGGSESGKALCLWKLRESEKDINAEAGVRIMWNQEPRSTGGLQTLEKARNGATRKNKALLTPWLPISKVERE